MQDITAKNRQRAIDALIRDIAHHIGGPDVEGQPLQHLLNHGSRVIKSLTNQELQAEIARLITEEGFRGSVDDFLARRLKV